jgi:hypothetical protein
MKQAPNTVFWSLVAAAGTLALSLALLGASALGRRRERRAWLMERGETS